MRKVLKFFILTAFLITALAVLFACKDNTDDNNDNNNEPNEQICLHRFDSYTVEKEPTTTSKGRVIGKCLDCGKDVPYTVVELGEEGYEVSIHELDCEKGGKYKYVSEYGTFYSEIKAPGHDYRIIGGIGTSCTEDGYEEYKCARCGKEYTKDVPASGHDFEETEKFDGNCTIPAYVIKVCKKCDIEETEYGEEVHSYNEEGVHKDGNCTEYGYTEFTCRLCGDVKKVNDEKFKHTYNKDTGACTLCETVCMHELKGYDCVECGLNIESKLETDGYFHYDTDKDKAVSLGESIFFGYYPKSNVRDLLLINALKAVKPDENGYYVYEGEKYVRRTLNQRYSGVVKFADGSVVANIRIDEEDYFYKAEPIEWIVKGISEDGKVLLETKQIIDTGVVCKSFYVNEEDDDYYKKDNGVKTKYYANSWNTSDLRTRLNGEFYNMAFDEKQREMLVLSTLKNSDGSGYYYDLVYGNNEDTEDYVFVASYSELFGEDEPMDNKNEERVKTATDIAIGSGLDLTETYETGVGTYFTRSVGRDTVYMCGINIDGALINVAQVSTIMGIVPRIYIEIPQK